MTLPPKDGKKEWIGDTAKLIAAIIFMLAVFGSVFYYHIWRALEFSKATGMGFLKSFFVMGN